MTVRTWVTISAIVLVLLGAAAAVRILSPIRAPEILVTVGETRLDGGTTRSCWPQRDGEARCVDGEPSGEPRIIPARGRMRVIAAYPVQPTAGTVRVVDGQGSAVLERDWTDRLDYRLAPGRYELHARADYGSGAFVEALFAFRIS